MVVCRNPVWLQAFCAHWLRSKSFCVTHLNSIRALLLGPQILPCVWGCVKEFQCNKCSTVSLKWGIYRWKKKERKNTHHYIFTSVFHWIQMTVDKGGKKAKNAIKSVIAEISIIAWQSIHAYACVRIFVQIWECSAWGCQVAAGQEIVQGTDCAALSHDHLDPLCIRDGLAQCSAFIVLASVMLDTGTCNSPQ